MAYTEEREINGKKYYYRVVSVREKSKVSKKRLYLGAGLSGAELPEREREADKRLLPEKTRKAGREVGRIKSEASGILRKNNVKRAGIFGSYARGEQTKNSDIDMLIQIDPRHSKDVSLLDVMRLEEALEKKLGRKVDLVEYSALHHLLRNKVMEEEVRIL